MIVGHLDGQFNREFLPAKVSEDIGVKEDETVINEHTKSFKIENVRGEPRSYFKDFYMDLNEMGRYLVIYEKN
jgi:hypothetical protein